MIKLGKRPPRTNSLFYTKHGELSLGPVMLMLAGAQGSFMMIAEGFGWAQHISVWAWAFWGSYVTMTFIAGAATDRARLIAHSKTPGEVGRAIAHASPVDGWPDDGIRPPGHYHKELGDNAEAES